MEREIFRYLDEGMTPLEVVAFEEMMNSNPSLKAEVEEASFILGKTLQLKSVQPDEDYFNESLARFREELASKQSSFFGKLAPATGLASMIIVALFYIFSLADVNTESENDFLSYLDSGTTYDNLYTQEYLYYSTDSTSSVIEDAFINQISLSETDLDYLAESYDIGYSEFLATLSDEEATSVLQEIDLKL